MDGNVNFPHKKVARIESNGASQHEKGNRHDEGIAKIEQTRNELFDLTFGEKVEDGIEEHVECRCPGSKE